MLKQKMNKYALWAIGTTDRYAKAAVIFFGLAAAFGWVLNIIKLAMMVNDDPVSISTVVIRILGIPVAFLGAVVGWF